MRLGDRVALLASHDGHLMLFVNNQLIYLVSCPEQLYYLLAFAIGEQVLRSALEEQAANACTH